MTFTGSGTLDATVRAIYPMADGGEVEPTKPGVVPMGDGGAFEQLTYRRGGVEAVGVEAVFEVWDGKPVCTRIALTADAEAGIPVRAKDLADIRLDGLQEDVFAAPGVFEHTADGWIYRPAARSARRRRVRQAARGRLTRSLLQKVAQTHAAAAGARVTAVADEFGVSMRTAHRYIAAARAAGLMPTEEEQE